MKSMAPTVTVIWESRFGPERRAEGYGINQRIWAAMTTCDGYLDHELLEDVDEPGHFVVVSHWSSRDAADLVRDRYASNPNAIRANALVMEPRRRFVGQTAGT
jgi:quinol monooxygenase YgiN